MVALTAPAPLQVPCTVLAVGQEFRKHNFTDFTGFKSSVFQITTQTSMPGLADSISIDSQSTTSTDDLSAPVVDLTDLDDIRSGAPEVCEEDLWPKATHFSNPWSAAAPSPWHPDQHHNALGFIKPTSLSSWPVHGDMATEAMHFAEPGVFSVDSWQMPLHFSKVWPGTDQQEEHWSNLHPTSMHQKTCVRSPPQFRDAVHRYLRPVVPPPGLETTAMPTLDDGAAHARAFVDSALPTVNAHFRKTRMCGFFQVGRCNRGDRCLYAHSSSDLRDAPDLTRTKMCPTFASGGKCQDARCRFAHSYGELRGTDGVYKTQLCRWWSQGFCKAGTTCRYAHGAEDLQGCGPDGGL